MADGKRAIIYVRISSDRTGAGIGVGRQEADCRELAASYGLAVVRVIVDNDLSASMYARKIRKGYQQLLRALRAGETDVVLAWHNDRLHRRPAELEEYITACETHDVITRTVKAGELDLSTPTGRFAARVIGNAAAYDAEHNAERIRSALAQNAEQGRWHGGMRAFGFEPDGTTLRLDESAAIAAGSNQVLAGVSLRSIARDWNTKGIFTSSGKRWTGAHVGMVLRRPRNAGLREHHGRLYPAAWPAIVNKDTWRAVCAVLDSPGRRVGPGPAPRWLGSGLFLCGAPVGDGECGETVTSGSAPGTGRVRVRKYRCTEPGTHVVRDGAALDAYIEAIVLALYERQGATIGTPTPDVDPAALHARLAVLRELRNEAARMRQRGEIDADQLIAATAENQREKHDIEQQLAVAAAGSPLAALAGPGVLEERWRALSVGVQQSIVAKLMTVTILPAPGKRPKGWQPGQSYFRTEYIRIDEKGAS